jgi:hypothetical protein
MRKLLCLALVVAACAKEKPSTPPTPAQKYAGVWEGRSFRTPTDTGVAWAITMKLDTAGKLSGSLTFTGATNPPVPVRILELTDSTVLQDLGPYMSPTANAEVVTRTTGRIAGDSLWGTLVMLPTQGGVTAGLSAAEWSNYETHPKKGAEPIRGTFAAKRKHTP